jgi:hypothetical protein
MLAKGSEESFEREAIPDACGEEAVSGNGVVEGLSATVGFYLLTKSAKTKKLT